MKINKKRALVGGAVALLLVGGLSVSMYRYNVNAEKERQVQQEKERKQALENEKQANEEFVMEAKASLLSAQKNPSSDNLKRTERAISKVKDARTAQHLREEVQGIKTRVKLENEAKQAVLAYQKDARSTEKLKKAQETVSKLTSDYSKALKAKLMKDIEASKAQAEKAQEGASKAQNEVKETASSSAQTETKASSAQAEISTVPGQDATGQVEATPEYTPAPPVTEGNNSTPLPPAGNEGTPTPPPSNGGGNGSNPTPPPGGGEVTPPPVETFTGWVKNRAGQVVWSQGGFSSLEEASRAAAVWANAQPNPEDAWSSGAY